jgi:hypothetical protein
MPAPEVEGVAAPTLIVPSVCKFPDELILMASTPPSKNANVLAAGKRMPVVPVASKLTLPLTGLRPLESMKATAVFAIFNARLESAFILSTLIVPAISSLYINLLFITLLKLQYEL